MRPPRNRWPWSWSHHRSSPPNGSWWSPMRGSGWEPRRRPGSRRPRPRHPISNRWCTSSSEGLPEGMGLVMGAWCGRKPTGELVEAVEKAGTFRVDSGASAAETVGGRGPLERAVEGPRGRPSSGPPAVWSSAGERRGCCSSVSVLPRACSWSRRSASSPAPPATARWTRRWFGDSPFPASDPSRWCETPCSTAKLEPLLDLVAAADAGSPINDWQGQRVDAGRFGPTLFGQVTNLQLQLLYLRRVAAAAGLERRSSPSRPVERVGTANGSKTTSAPICWPDSRGCAVADDPSGRQTADALFPRRPLLRAPDGTPTTSSTAALAEASKVEAGIRQEPFPLEVVDRVAVRLHRPQSALDWKDHGKNFDGVGGR